MAYKSLLSLNKSINFFTKKKERNTDPKLLNGIKLLQKISISAVLVNYKEKYLH